MKLILTLTLFACDAILLNLACAEPASGGSGDQRKKREEAKYIVEFKNTPWREVLEWFVDQTEVPFSAPFVPTGTFSYSTTPGRKYTLSEVNDIINDGMMKHGYMLTFRRRPATYTIVPIDSDRPDRSIIVNPENLDEVGDRVTARMIIHLKHANAEQVISKVTPILSSHGSALVVPGLNAIHLNDEIGHLRKAAQVIGENDHAPRQCDEPSIRWCRPRRFLLRR